MRRGCGRAASDRDIDPEQRGDALLFAAESSDLFTRVVVSSDLDFAVAQICYSTTPESAAIVLLGTCCAIVLMRRRTRRLV